jgi:hypothetical protein
VSNWGDDVRTEAIVYRHWDGYPEVAGADVLRFFEQVRAQTQDTRFDDPSYLAARYVVFLADIFRDAGAFSSGKMLDFISVGIVQDDPGDIEYRYIVNCSERDDDGNPIVTCVSTRTNSRFVINAASFHTVE